MIVQTGFHAFAADHVMIMAAPNGARRGKADHGALPVSADELAECAGALVETGASVLHLHVRDSAGRHTLAPAAYRAAMRKIRARIGDAMVLQVTTEAIGQYTRQEQMAVVRELRPEAVSLALRELCPDGDAEPGAAAFFAWLVRERIWPQYILYSAADLRNFCALRARGFFLEENPSCLLVLGRYANRQDGDPGDIDSLLAEAAPGSLPWTVCCFGPREHEAMRKALALGGHVRIGFENNLLLADGRPARDNAALIAEFTAAADESPRRPANADEVRHAFLGAL